MEAACSEIDVKDIPTYKFTPPQYLVIVQKAMERLQWRVSYIGTNSIECHTFHNDHPGDIITVAMTRANATIRIRPIDEYFCDEQQMRQNPEMLQKAIEQIAREVLIADRNLHPMHREKYGALVFSKSYKVTPFLVYINALVFLAMILTGVSFLNPTALQLYQWGGNLRPAVMHGEWWRLVTYMFLHGGVVHLLMNTFALLYIGMYLEPLIGRARFAGAYLFTGVCAGLMSLYMHPASVGVGASGAIFGMYGVFLALLTTNYIKKTLRRTMLRGVLFFVLLNLLYGLQGNTDNAAHIGGLLSGIVIGFVLRPRRSI